MLSSFVLFFLGRREGKFSKYDNSFAIYLANHIVCIKLPCTHSGYTFKKTDSLEMCRLMLWGIPAKIRRHCSVTVCAKAGIYFRNIWLTVAHLAEGISNYANVSFSCFNASKTSGLFEPCEYFAVQVECCWQLHVNFHSCHATSNGTAETIFHTRSCLSPYSCRDWDRERSLISLETLTELGCVACSASW